MCSQIPWEMRKINKLSAIPIHGYFIGRCINSYPLNKTNKTSLLCLTLGRTIGFLQNVDTTLPK